jgi:hypothetical protein
MVKAKLSEDILRIMKENEKYAKMLEEYDRTGVLPIAKKSLKSEKEKG